MGNVPQHIVNRYKYGNLSDTKLHDLLLKAIETNNEEVIKAILVEVPKINSTLDMYTFIHEWNDQLLRRASEVGNVQAVKLLIDLNADVHVAGELSLINALRNKHIEVAKLLVEANADIHVNNDAIIKSTTNYDSIKFLIDNKADVKSLSKLLKNEAKYLSGNSIRLLAEYKVNVTQYNDKAIKDATSYMFLHFDTIATLLSLRASPQNIDREFIETSMTVDKDLPFLLELDNLGVNMMNIPQPFDHYKYVITKLHVKKHIEEFIGNYVSNVVVNYI